MGFQFVEDALGLCVGLDDCVNVGGSDVGSQEGPAAVSTVLLDGSEGDRAALFVEMVGRVTHGAPFGGFAGGVRWEKAGTHEVVMAVDGAGGVAVESGAVAGEGEEVGH